MSVRIEQYPEHLCEQTGTKPACETKESPHEGILFQGQIDLNQNRKILDFLNQLKTCILVSEDSSDMHINRILKSSIDHGSSDLSRVDYLDGWRGLAIILVLMEHFLHVNWINVGKLGVDAFFVLSGMLMANILFEKRTNIKRFYKRRISRILPAFFLYVIFVSSLSYFFELSDEHKNIIYNLLFIRAYAPESPDILNSGLPIGHLWSLSVEEHSYVILSVLAVFPFLAKRAHILITLLGFLSIGCFILYKLTPEIAPQMYHVRTEVVASFLMLSAGYSLIKTHYKLKVPTWLPLITILLAIFCYSPLGPPGGRLVFAPFLLAFSINHLDLTPDTFKTLLSNPLLRLIGVLSFSIYLWQQPLYFYFTKSGYAFPFAGPLLLFASILLGAISFYLVENPARRYLNNRW